MKKKFNWTDNPTVSGLSVCDTDILNECLMYLKYNHISSGAGRNIGDIFWTTRLNDSLNGAYPCTGLEFSKNDFTGENNPYTLLENGQIPSLTYEEYEQALKDNNGNCGFFGIDTTNKKFKVPTLSDIYISCESKEKICQYKPAGLPEISGKFDRPNRNGAGPVDGCFSQGSSVGGYCRDGSSDSSYVNFNASKSNPIYGSSDTVRPKTISYRAMVQLANEVDDNISIESYTQRLEEKTHQGLESLSNASNTLRETQITNCILESPQKIKIEFDQTSKTLTLKAGSIITIPNGLDENNSLQFEYYKTTSDLFISSQETSNIDVFINLSSDKTKLNTLSTARTFSGKTKPTGTTPVYWYDTENNLIKYSPNPSNTEFNGKSSLPICLLGTKDSKFTNVKSIFDNFGFIGSTFWIDKGVKILIPNGRNENGSLNNKEYLTEKTFIHTITQEESSGFDMRARLYIDINNVSSNDYAISWWSENSITNNWIEPNNNIVNRYFDNQTNFWKESWLGAEYKNKIFCVLGNFHIKENRISNFQIPQPFKAIDYNDYISSARIIDTYQNGTSWYRVWSDGFIEQGGKADGGSASGGFNCNFIKPYTNENTINITFGQYTPNIYPQNPISLSGREISKTDFQVGMYGGRAYFYWRATGY